MTLSRSFDSAWFNQLLNHPSVHCWVAGDLENLDATALIGDERNILLRADKGGFLFHFHEPGTYEVHTQFLPEGRGVLELAKQAAHYLFTKTDCVEILTRVPVGHAAAKKLTLAMGFTKLFTGSKWKLHGETVPVEFYRLGIEEWIANAEGLVERGEWFHKELERLGAEAEHEDDVVHDRYVGAAVEMILNGQVGKGVAYYNRWAKFYGYDLIACVSRDPLIIDIRTARLKVANDSFEVMQCQ